jgi:hypothetical protein
MTYDELLERVRRLSRDDKLRLRQWLDQHLQQGESEVRSRDFSLGGDVQEMRTDPPERDYLPSLD